MAETDPGPAAMRSCIKPGCRWPAAATLSYRYATAEVWLSDLGEDHPSTHDLCPHHADDMRVPRGWTLVDDRRHVEAVREPSAAEIVERNTKLRSNVEAMLEQPPAPQVGRSRYADLLADLPTYEAPAGEAPSAEGQDDDPGAPVEVEGSGHDDRSGDLVASGQGPRMLDLGVGHRAVPAPHPHDGEPVHETGLRGAVVVQLPLRTDTGEDV